MFAPALRPLLAFFYQVIIAGTAENVERSIRASQKYREDLLKRGVLIIPLVWSKNNPTKPKKKLGFGVRPPVVRPSATSVMTSRFLDCGCIDCGPDCVNSKCSTLNVQRVFDWYIVSTVYRSGISP